jgi:hypothetical protein
MKNDLVAKMQAIVILIEFQHKKVKEKLKNWLAKPEKLRKVFLGWGRHQNKVLNHSLELVKLVTKIIMTKRVKEI